MRASSPEEYTPDGVRERGGNDRDWRWMARDLQYLGIQNCSADASGRGARGRENSLLFPALRLNRVASISRLPGLVFLLAKYRSEGRMVGKECVGWCRSGGAPVS